jgi:hypothetical protein
MGSYPEGIGQITFDVRLRSHRFGYVARLAVNPSFKPADQIERPFSETLSEIQWHLNSFPIDVN